MLSKYIIYAIYTLLSLTEVYGKHYILYTRPSHEISFMDSYYYSKHLCSVDFVNSISTPSLRNVTNINNNTNSSL